MLCEIGVCAVDFPRRLRIPRAVLSQPFFTCLNGVTLFDAQLPVERGVVLVSAHSSGHVVCCRYNFPRQWLHGHRRWLGGSVVLVTFETYSHCMLQYGHVGTVRTVDW